MNLHAWESVAVIAIGLSSIGVALWADPSDNKGVLPMDYAIRRMPTAVSKALFFVLGMVIVGVGVWGLVAAT